MIEAKKVLPLSSLEVMIEPLRPLAGPKAVLLDACKGQWFYGIEHDGKYEEGIDVSDGVIARLQKLGIAEIATVGDVFERYPKILAASPVRFLEAPIPFHQNLQGRSLASLAAKKLAASPEWVAWEALEPRYFRLSDAEIKLAASNRG
jgi:tRNA A37 threonylcarbamoyladenosine modification protein TsaB